MDRSRLCLLACGALVAFGSSGFFAAAVPTVNSDTPQDRCLLLRQEEPTLC
jgi:hypothetical protein